MKVIFSTALAVYTFDCNNRTLERIVGAGVPEYYGISATPNGIVFSNSYIDNGSLTDHEAYTDASKGCLLITSHLRTHSIAAELCQPHQIECHQHFTICANSGRNSITVVTPDSQVLHYYPTRTRFDIGPNGRRGNHFNSVHLRDGIVHVIAHNYDRLSTLWLFAWPTFELIDVIATRSQWAHNIMCSGEDFVVCNSKEAALYSVRDQRNFWELDSARYITRGLAATADYVFVGSTALASRGNRKNCDAAIYVLDRRNMKTMGKYDFPGIGGIHEIRLLDIEDDCHAGAVISASQLITEPVGQNAIRESEHPSVVFC